MTSPRPKSNDRHLCSVRRALVTLVVVLLLILAAGIALGIVFGVIYPQKSGSATSSQNSFSTTSAPWILSSVSIGSQTGAPCSAYTTINDPTRGVTEFGSTGPCDDGPLFNASNGGSWIRFVGTGGTIIPLASAGMNHCGGYLTAWFNGTLPTVANVISNQSVCFEALFSQCTWHTDVQVVLCPGNYFVYFLPPVSVCNARYCTV